MLQIVNAAVAVKYEKVNNLSIYLITFFFPSSVNILVWIIKKAIALKFADPLVKLFLLACPLRIWLSDWDHHSHLLWSSPHVFAVIKFHKQCDLCTVAHYFGYNNINCVQPVTDTFIFNMKFLCLVHKFSFICPAPHTNMSAHVGVCWPTLGWKETLNLKAPRKHLLVEVLTTCYCSSHCCFPSSLLLKSEVETDMTT